MERKEKKKHGISPPTPLISHKDFAVAAGRLLDELVIGGHVWKSGGGEEERGER